jgi:hypothetical protein
MKSHRTIESFEECPLAKAKDYKVLDCMWVFTYKFDKAGNLLKVKVRLVVRGD